MEFFKKIIIFAIFFCTQLNPIDINHIKDTYSILSDEFKHCSPVYGAVWIETQILKKCYKFGEPEHATVKLVKELFYLIEDSFSITRNLGMPAHYFSCKIIGLIIGTIEKSKIENKKGLPEKLRNLIGDDPDFIQKCQEGLKEKWADKNQQRIMRDRVKKLSSIISKSLEECGFWEKQGQIYPSYTTYVILLGFLYKLSNDKKDLRVYLNSLNDTVEKDIFSITGKNLFESTTWESTHFSKSDVDSIIKACDKKSSSNMLVPFLTEVGQELSNKFDPFEAIVFAEITKQFYSRSLPRIISNRRDNIYFDGRPFSDCTEITMRNLCNFLVFDQEELKFVPIKAGNLNPSQELMRYYQGDCADATKHLRSDMYQTWGNLMQNIPGVIYTAMLSKSNPRDRYERLLGNEIFFREKAKPCFVLLPKDDMKKIGISSPGTYNRFDVAGEPYVFADPQEYKAYALWPSLKNVIILLNRFFGLELYKDDLFAPFKDAHFCSKYFPIVCEKLGWSFTLPRGCDIDQAYFMWNCTIPMHLTNAPEVSWGLFVKWHHTEVKDLKTPSPLNLPKGYKEKLYNQLRVFEESLDSNALLALYAPKTSERETDLQLKLEQLKGALSGLKNKLSFLQKKLANLESILKNP